MATITERPAANLSVSSKKVRDPLGRLRGAIRTYVISEVLTSLLLFLAICFWLGLALDYGSFQIGLDWTRDLPRWLRASLLVIGLCLVAFLVDLRKSLKRADTRHAATLGSTGNRKLDGFAMSQVSLLVLFAVAFIGFAIWRDARDSLFTTKEGGEKLNGILTDAMAQGQNPVAVLDDLRNPVGMPGVLIVGGLLLLFAGILIVRRMLYEFSDSALALVLEKRFPKLLGDRLITAVELADTRQAARYGYSAVMVEQTIHEAADCVDQLNIREVFDWKRLYVRLAIALILTVGVYALIFGSMASIAATQGKSPGEQFTALNDTAAIWAERNIRLDNERWPTRALLQLIDFPNTGELKKGKGSEGGKELTRVDIRCVALEYVLHDSNARLSWRPLLVADLLAGKVPVVNTAALQNVPQGWEEHNREIGWTVDAVKVKLQRIKDGDKTLARPDETTLAGLESLIEELDSLAEQGSMSRTLRKLIVPTRAYVVYQSDDGQIRAAISMQQRANNEFTAELSLKDSVRFALSAEDFVSDASKITLVPPPRIAKLDSIERQPAYLYHLTETTGRILPSVFASTVGLLAAPSNALVAASALPEERPYDDDRFFLGQRKQLFKPRTVNVSGELKPKISVPATTDVTLVAETDKDLKDESIILDGKGALALKNVQPRKTGTRTFEIVVPDVRSDLDFRLEFKDTDGVLGIQELQIVIDEDAPPSIDQFTPAVVREVNGKYKVTPQAVIPFTFFVKDPKFGLAELDFAYTIKETASQGEQSRRACRVAGGIGLGLSGPEAALSSSIYNLALPGTLKGNEEVLEGRLPVADFKAQMDRLRQFRDPEGKVRRRWEETASMLDTPMAFGSFPKMILSYNLPELKNLDKFLIDHERLIEDSAPLKSMDLSLIRRIDSTGLSVPLKARPLEIQRKFDLTLTLEARDTNVARARRGQHISQPISFEIVSEIELLFEINQEEQRLYDELFKAVADLKKSFEQLQGVKFDLLLEPVPGRPVNFDSYSVRTEDVQKVVRESERMTLKVMKDYEKILQEMRTNRIENLDVVRKTKNAIVIPLQQILVGDYLLLEGDAKVRTGFNIGKDGLKYLRDEVDDTKRKEDDRLARARSSVAGAEKDLSRLLAALTEVLQEMEGIKNLGEILKGLNQLELSERDSLQRIEVQKGLIEKRLFESLLTPPKP